MSLYRTWRPRTFADLVGQDAVVRTITSAIESDKLAHAYLFSGPRGSGKTSAAKILARCIDCVNGPTATPDNTCENCLAILSGTALDVLEIDAASNRGIDEIRALRDAVKFAPASMRMKVYIIDEAHMLTKEGANAFLKTLEEPPPHAVFILATTEPEKLPVTILSRCQRYAFRRIAIPVMIERMREIAAAEAIVIDDDALAAIAYRADGGLRDALTMLEQAAAFADGAITAQTIDLAFGASGRNYAATLLDAVFVYDARAALAAVEEASDAGTDMQVLIRSLIAGFRNVLIARIDPALLARDLAPEDAARATQQADGVAQATIVRALRIFTDAANLARTGGNARLELETALLRFVLASEDPTLDAIAARIAALEEGTPTSATPRKRVAAPVTTAAIPKLATTTSQTSNEPRAAEVPVAPSAPNTSREAGVHEPAHAATTPISLQRVRAAWQHIRGRVERESAPLRAPLSRTSVDAVDDQTIVLGLPDALSLDILRDHVKLLETAIVDVLGASLRVKLTVESTTARAAKAAQAVAEPEERDEDVDALFNYANERIRER